MQPKIKVCGLTRPEDLAACFSSGIDFSGLIFAAKSPRYVSLEQATALPSDPTGNCKRVGIFVKQSLDEVLHYAKTARLDFLQLHGGEDPEFCQTVGPERVIKVLWPQKITPEELEREFERFAPVCAYFLLDAGVSGGGSGQKLPLDMLSALRPPRPWFLAGGLDEHSAIEALRVCKPFALDFNSALEISPGIKDPQRIKNLKRLVL